MSAKEPKLAYPEEPWYWRPEWHAGLIKSSGKTEAVDGVGVLQVEFTRVDGNAAGGIARELCDTVSAVVHVDRFGTDVFCEQGVPGGTALWHADLKAE